METHIEEFGDFYKCPNTLSFEGHCSAEDAMTRLEAHDVYNACEELRVRAQTVFNNDIRREDGWEFLCQVFAPIMRDSNYTRHVVRAILFEAEADHLSYENGVLFLPNRTGCNIANRCCCDGELGNGTAAIVHRGVMPCSITTDQETDGSQHASDRVIYKKYFSQTEVFKRKYEIQLARKLMNSEDGGLIEHDDDFCIFNDIGGRSLHECMNDFIYSGERGVQPDFADAVLYHAIQELRSMREKHPGFIHRDICPENIVLTPHTDRRLQYIDFHVSCVDGINDPYKDCRLGHPGYIASEIESRQGRYSFSSDLYSLGCVYYHMIFGATPWMNLHTHGDFLDRKSELIEALGDERDQVLRTLLDRMPEHRDADAVLKWLRDLSAHEYNWSEKPRKSAYLPYQPFDVIRARSQFGYPVSAP